MKRILNIQEYILEDSFNRAVRLSVLDENGNSLQGSITVEELDDIKLDLFNRTKCENEEQKTAPRYFVYNPFHEGKPRKIYDDYNKALNDAKDIAKKYNRCNIYVLEIKAEITRTNIVRETITENEKLTGECNFEDIPF